MARQPTVGRKGATGEHKLRGRLAACGALTAAGVLAFPLAVAADEAGLPPASSMHDDCAGCEVALTAVIEEFFTVESVFPQEKHELQSMLGVEFRRLRGSSWEAPVTVELEYGLNSRWQVSAGVPWAFTNADDGKRHGELGDVGIGLLYNAIARVRSAMSVSLEVSIPTGHEDNGDDEDNEFELLLIFARDFGRAQLHVNAGGEFAREESAVVFNAGVTFRTGALIPSLELSALGGEEALLYVTPGLHWRAAEGTYLGIGVSAGLTDESARFALLAAFTVEF